MSSEFVDLSDIRDLRIGDIVQSKLTGDSYVVAKIEWAGRTASAVRLIAVTNPPEWRVMRGNRES